MTFKLYNTIKIVAGFSWLIFITGCNFSNIACFDNSTLCLDYNERKASYSMTKDERGMRIDRSPETQLSVELEVCGDVLKVLKPKGIIHPSIEALWTVIVDLDSPSLIKGANVKKIRISYDKRFTLIPPLKTGDRLTFFFDEQGNFIDMDLCATQKNNRPTKR